MTLSAVPNVVADDHIFLSGRPPLGEYLGFVIAHTVGGAVADRAQLASDWRAANDRVKELERVEVGAADRVRVFDVSEALAPLAEAVLAHPVVQQSYALTPISIGMVELDGLVVHQKAINLGQVARIKGNLGDAPDEKAIFGTCFPLDRTLDPPWGVQEGGDGWAFVSPSNDFRFLGSQLLPAALIPDTAGLPGAPVAVMLLAVGYSVNVLAAAKVEGRLVLTNGSHRAYALRDLGVTHVPCLVQEISRRDELELLGIPDLSANPDAYVTSPRPPMLKDYFDPALRIVAAVPRKDRHVQVGFRPNAVDLPAPPR